MRRTFKALFKQLTVSGDTKILLVLDPDDEDMLSEIAKLTNKRVLVGITDMQTQLPIGDDGEGW